MSGLVRDHKSLKCSVTLIMSTHPLERVQVYLVKIPAIFKTDYKYLMTCKDHFSRLGNIYFLENKKSSTTAENIAKNSLPNRANQKFFNVITQKNLKVIS